MHINIKHTQAHRHTSYLLFMIIINFCCCCCCCCYCLWNGRAWVCIQWMESSNGLVTDLFNDLYTQCKIYKWRKNDDHTHTQTFSIIRIRCAHAANVLFVSVAAVLHKANEHNPPFKWVRAGHWPKILLNVSIFMDYNICWLNFRSCIYIFCILSLTTWFQLFLRLLCCAVRLCYRWLFGACTVSQ